MKASIPPDALAGNHGLRDIRILAEWHLAHPPRVIVPRRAPRTALQAYLRRNWPRVPATFRRAWVPIAFYGEGSPRG